MNNLQENEPDLLNLKQKMIDNELVIDNSNDSEMLPLMNEIFLIDPQTNKVHSLIRQIIPNGDQDVSELAVKHLKNHLESGGSFKKENDMNSSSAKGIDYQDRPEEVFALYGLEAILWCL